MLIICAYAGEELRTWMISEDQKAMLDAKFKEPFLIPDLVERNTVRLNHKSEEETIDDLLEKGKVLSAATNMWTPCLYPESYAIWLKEMNSDVDLFLNPTPLRIDSPVPTKAAKPNVRAGTKPGSRKEALYVINIGR